MGAEKPSPGNVRQGDVKQDNVKPGAGQQDEAMDPKALAILNHMAEYLAQAPRFSVTIRAGYDVVQDTGEKVEFGEQRIITLSRPDRLRIEARESDGKQKLVIFDGKQIAMSDPNEKVYGQVERAGSVDEVMRYLLQDLHMRMPLALLLSSTLPADLQQRLQSIDYVERDTLTTEPTDHLIGRTSDVDFQIWVAAGDTPLPQRLVITYRDDKGQPQYRAAFSEWNLNPDVSPDRLAFHPPEGAERIPILARTRRTADAPSPKSPETPSRTGNTAKAPK